MKKQRKKGAVALSLILSMIVSLISPFTVAIQAAEPVTNRVGDFYYAAEEFSAKDYQTTYYYSDGYFSESAYTYQDSLATMSLCMSMASGRSNRTKDYSKKTQNLEALLKQCGFEKFSANEGYTTKPGKNSTGVACANKKIKANGKEYTLIALAICGARFEAEWGGALEIGNSGNVKNAEIGAEEALKFLQEYVANEKIHGDVKVWISSYALGAGKANLLASKLDDGASIGEDVSLDLKDIYTYCFQTSKVAQTNYGLNDKVYRNIFTVNNPYTPCTHIAPSAYGFGIFGVVKNLPTSNTDSQYGEKRDAMLKQLEKIDGTTRYLTDDFQPKKISLFGDGMVDNDTDCKEDQAGYIDLFIDAFLDTCASTRQDYTNEFQGDLCDLSELVFGSPDDNWTDCTNIFINKVVDNILDVGIQMVLGNQDKLAEMFKEYTYDALAKSGVTTYSDADVDKFATLFAKLAIRFATNHPNMTITFFSNLAGLFQANYAPYTLAWLRSVDENYIGDGRDINKCSVSLSKSSFTYDGKAKKPQVKITNGDVLLTEGTDYQLSYSNNVKAGTAKLTIKGIGLYSGTIQKTFKIVKAKNEIKAANRVITWSEKGNSFSLKASAKEKAKISYRSDNKKITVNSKGTVKVAAKYIGKATLTLKSSATDNYSSVTKKITITVNPTKTALSYVKSNKKGALNMKWGKNASAGGYQIYYSTAKDFSSGTKAVKVSKNSVQKTITGLNSKKVYYVKIRAYQKSGKTTYYGAWSSVKSKKVN